MIIGLIAQLIWSQLCDLSFLTVNTLIALSPSGIASVIQAVMIKYVYFDILFTELWFDDFMMSIGLNLDGVKDDGPLSAEFESNGYGSK